MVGELKSSKRLVWLKWKNQGRAGGDRTVRLRGPKVMEPCQPWRGVGLLLQVRWQPQEVLSRGAT